MHEENTNTELKKNQTKSWDRITIILLIISFLVIIFSFIAPFLFTHHYINDSFDFTTTGQIGDTFGGITNPFIALAGVLLTFLAFYMQIKANQIQRELFREQLIEDRKRLNDEMKLSTSHFQEQIELQESQHKIQQFESQFYKMLELHKENVNEMNVIAYRNPETEEVSYITGRNVFVEFQNEFELMISEIKNSNHSILNTKTFKICYDIFWWGKSKYYFKGSNLPLAEIITQSDPNDFESILGKYQQAQRDSLNFDYDKIHFSIRAFEGHSHTLSHYYRHLYQTVKIVDKYPITYIEKMKYLTILRAQLSNQEQAMLFYNWLSGYGGAWQNGENKYFTEYKMIHNLWYDNLPKDNFILDEIKKLQEFPVVNRTSKMFEADEI